MEHKIKILICEDDLLLLGRLTDFAAGEGHEVHQASDGASALAMTIQNKYDILVTDIRLPGVNGIELIGKLKESSPSTIVIAITGHASVDYAVACLRHGALDFLIKPFTREDFADALSNAVNHTLYGKKRDESETQPDGGHTLTARELEVLNWAKDGKNNWEIAKILNISEATTKFHLSNIYRKLSVTNRASAVACAIEQKLI